MADETNILKILEDERKQREADKLNDAIRQRIAALTEEEIGKVYLLLPEIVWNAKDDDIDALKTVLVALLAPEAT